MEVFSMGRNVEQITKRSILHTHPHNKNSNHNIHVQKSSFDLHLITLLAHILPKRVADDPITIIKSIHQQTLPPKMTDKKVKVSKRHATHQI